MHLLLLCLKPVLSGDSLVNAEQRLCLIVCRCRASWWLFGGPIWQMSLAYRCRSQPACQAGVPASTGCWVPGCTANMGATSPLNPWALLPGIPASLWGQPRPLPPPARLDCGVSHVPLKNAHSCSPCGPGIKKNPPVYQWPRSQAVGLSTWHPQRWAVSLQVWEMHSLYTRTCTCIAPEQCSLKPCNSLLLQLIYAPHAVRREPMD